MRLDVKELRKNKNTKIVSSEEALKYVKPFFEDLVFEESSIKTINLSAIKKLNMDKIKAMDDIKRVLDALDIKFEVREGVTNLAYEKIKDLCN